jgi:alpha-galactosidase
MALTYTVFEDSDVITRRATIYNDGTNSVRIKGLASAQLDLDADDWNLVTFDGAWARERYMNERPLLPESTSMTAKPVSPVPTTTPAYSSRRTTGSASA